MKVLNLVAHSLDIEAYANMQQILSPYYKKFGDIVDTFFIVYDKELDVDYKFEDDILIIKGDPSLVPGVLWKTIDSMLILIDQLKNYDYVVRTSVSTVINFNPLLKFLDQNPNADYIGGKLFNLQWVAPTHGIVDDKWFGTIFSQGTMIVMSEKFYRFLLKNRHKFRTELADDVSFGVFLKEHYLKNNIAYEIPPDQYIELVGGREDIESISNIHCRNNPIAWRNKSIDRQNDVHNITNIINVINNYNT